MKKEQLKRTLFDLTITIGLLVLITGLAFILFLHISNNPANIALLYVIGIITIANCTNGHLCGIFAAVCGVICINGFFTYPYYSIDFSQPDYPATFLCMGVLFSIASIAATHMRQQARILTAREQQLLEAEKEKLRANLLRAVSHDLRTPLTSILGASASLEENWDNYQMLERLELIHTIHDEPLIRHPNTDNGRGTKYVSGSSG